MMQNMYDGKHGNMKISVMLAVFPVPSVFLKRTATELNILSLVYQIQCSLNPKQVIQPTYLAIEIMETSEKMEQLHQQLFMLHKTQCEIGVLQSAFEREPQTVVQISLVILMKNFKRIKLLFST